MTWTVDCLQFWSLRDFPVTVWIEVTEKNAVASTHFCFHYLIVSGVLATSGAKQKEFSL